MRFAQSRREQELRQLVAEGVPLRALAKSGHWVLGSLHIYTQSGRWFCETTGKRGRLRGLTMGQIIGSQYPRRGEQLCPEAADHTRQMEVRYRHYDEFTRQYEEFTRRYIELINKPGE